MSSQKNRLDEYKKHRHHYYFYVNLMMNQEDRTAVHLYQDMQPNYLNWNNQEVTDD